MPGDTSGRPPSHVDFAAFCDARYDDLRKAFAGANFLGLKPEDILHDTMMQARRQHRRFASDDELYAWCVTVGVRRMRRLAKQRANSQREDPHPSLDALALASPESVEDSAVARDEIARLMSMLLPQYAEVLQLAADGHDRREIARRLGITPAAAGMLLYRARRAARECWAKLVAAAAVFVAGLRRLHRATPTLQAQAVVLSMAVAATLVLPAPGVTGRAIASAPSRPTATTTHPAQSKPHTPDSASRTAAKPNVPQARTTVTVRDHKPATTGLVPHVPRTCTSGVCVGPSCSAKGENGDALYVKLYGPCGYSVTEDKTPVCQDVADNPVVGCERRGKPQWKVDPLPSPGGTPL